MYSYPPPTLYGHQISPIAPVGGLTSLLGATLNNGMGIYEMGAAPTAMERVITDNLCRKLGFDGHSNGFLTSGGTLANLTALLSARRHYLNKGGVSQAGDQDLVVVVSEEAHYCIDRAVKIMGLGENGLVKIPVDSNFQMRADLLAEYLHSSGGKNVIAIVGSAPSTATGIYDNISQLTQLAKQYNIWLHIDGAHGGAAIFSEKYKHLLQGIDQADSVVIDGHKMMMIPAITTALLFKDGRNSHLTFRQKADYLLEESQEEDWYNLAKRTFECTKHMMSLHWFALLKLYGEKVFEEFVTRLYDLSREFGSQITNDPDFELAVSPMSNILCFRYIGESKSGQTNNALNKKIRKEILEAGKYYIVQTKLGEQHFLRTTIMNPFSSADHFKGLLAEIKKIAQ